MKDCALPPVQSESWIKSPIDRFILSRMEKEGLRPAAPASRLTLLRRVTFDLTGLPPAPNDIAAFLADTSPDAFSRVVDRLLASPAYGEKWGRHWLDVARYADSTGMDEDHPYPHAWRYRDYVIDAFNRDLPYDRFVTEQIAGDLLPAARRTLVADGLPGCRSEAAGAAGPAPDGLRRRRRADRRDLQGLHGAHDLLRALP